MKNLRLIITLIIAFFIFDKNIHASSFVNKYNVVFSENEYDFISEMVFDGYQNIMTDKDYNYFFLQRKNKVNYSLDTINSNYYETNGKIIKISYNCISDCLVTLTVNWKIVPKVRSYDIIGAYIENGNIISYGNLNILYDNDSDNVSSVNMQTNGFGAVFKLKNVQTQNVNIIQTFRVSNKSKIYASYQHAKKTISYSNANSFIINKNGLGNVFKFNNSFGSYYDAMNGVNIIIN